MRPWEARWFRFWAARTPRPRSTRTPSTLFISAPARGLAWLLNTVQKR